MGPRGAVPAGDEPTQPGEWRDPWLGDADPERERDLVAEERLRAERPPHHDRGV